MHYRFICLKREHLRRVFSRDFVLLISVALEVFFSRLHTGSQCFGVDVVSCSPNLTALYRLFCIVRRERRVEIFKQ
jgi:hypothetical protein